MVDTWHRKVCTCSRTQENTAVRLFFCFSTHPKRLSCSRQAESETSSSSGLIWAFEVEAINLDTFCPQWLFCFQCWLLMSPLYSFFHPPYKLNAGLPLEFGSTKISTPDVQKDCQKISFTDHYKHYLISMNILISKQTLDFQIRALLNGSKALHWKEPPLEIIKASSKLEKHSESVDHHQGSKNGPIFQWQRIKKNPWIQTLMWITPKTDRQTKQHWQKQNWGGRGNKSAHSNNLHWRRKLRPHHTEATGCSSRFNQHSWVKRVQPQLSAVANIYWTVKQSFIYSLGLKPDETVRIYNDTKQNRRII